MRNVLLVFRQEIYKTLHSPGTMIFAFILPLAAMIVLLVAQYVQGRSGVPEGDQTSPSSQYEIKIEGFVDQSNLVQLIPDKFPPDSLIRYENELQAQQALESGKITAYYLVPPDVLERGQAYYVYPDSRSYLDDGQPWIMSWTLIVNLLEGNAALAEIIWNPIGEVTATSLAGPPKDSASNSDDCSRPGSACQSSDLVRYMPSLMTALFCTFFMTNSSRLFNSISTEKENRVIEVLLLSVSPRQLLAGKTLGLGLVGSLQTITWLGALVISFNLGGSTLKLPDNFVFPIDILIWGMVYFLGGFGLYAGLMAGIGALAPNMKEAGAAIYIVLFPLFIGYVFGLMAPLTKTADTAFLVFLSIFPMTSPVVMIMRLTNNLVPVWQLMLSIVFLFGSVSFVMRSAAIMFKNQNLLSGQPFSLRRYLQELR